MAEIDFYFDVYSPFAYLASHRIGEIADTYSQKINYFPIDLVKVKKAVGNTGPANTDIPLKLRYLLVDLKRWADRYGLPLEMPPRADCNRINKGALFAKQYGRERSYIREAYAQVWGKGENPDSNEVLSQVAKTMGWDPAEFLAFIASDATEATYQKIFDHAINRGVFGVPYTIIGDEAWWGNDRLSFVEEALSSEVPA